MPDTAELHFHALPGVDDGPETLDDAVALIALAVEQGTTTIVATPHVRMDHVTEVHGLTARVKEVRAALRRAGVGVDLRRGAELGHEMVGRLDQAELDSVAQGPPGARWLLVETPFEGIDESFHAATGELRDRGFGVLVAHPERSADADLYESAGLLRELRAGSLAQVNAQSVLGAHGARPRRAALDLIARGLVAAVSSDAHGPARPPLLREAAAHLAAQGTDPRLCRSLISSAPRRLLARGVRRPAALVA